METGALYYGDNLGILRDFIADESVDLIYLDPPFNSSRDYNLIFKDQSGHQTDAQILAFEDTWTWGPDASDRYDYLTNSNRHHGRVPDGVSQIVGALRAGIGPSEMLAYLVEMTVRLVELRRVLKETGSIWLHCDPTSSHYLKLVMDAVFTPRAFRNEVIWKRSYGHGDSRRSLGRSHDVLLLYTVSDHFTLNPFYHEHDPRYLDSFFTHADKRGRYKLENLTSPNPRPNLTYPYKGYPPPEKGWRVNLKRMQELDADDRLYYPRKPGGRIMKKVYLDELPGQPMTDIWTDIRLLSAHDQERLGYPTQKPLALLERIIGASSNPNDVVLDPFCGCGTALIASQKLGRRWIGIDVTYLAIAVMKARLRDSFGIEAPIIGAPTEVEGARALAEQGLTGRYQFQQWALTLVDAAPTANATPKKGADAGIDGRLTFTDAGGQLRTVIVSVKSGGVNVSQIRDLIGTIGQQSASMGLFLTLDEPSAPMRHEAAAAGEFYSELAKRSYPKIQILTIKELLEGKRPEIPLLVLPTYAQAEKVQESPGQQELFG